MSKKNYDLMSAKDRDIPVMQVRLKNGKGADYITYNPDLVSILFNGKWHFSFFYHDNRLMAYYWRGPWKGCRKLYLYDLALACYLGMVRADTFEDDFKSYCAWKKEHELTVDHLDGNTHNNTVRNLAPMPGADNRKKKSFPAGFVPPYNLITAYVDGEYRVQLRMENTAMQGIQAALDSVLPGMFKLNEAGWSTMNFVCSDSGSLVSCIKHLYDSSYSWCNPGETARAYKRGHKDIPHMAADIRRSIEAQEELALMDRTMFQPWQVTE